MSYKEVEVPKREDMRYSIYIVGSNYGVRHMFKRDGHTIVTDISKNPDLVVFTGGEDISPWLYGQRPHARTLFSMTRDMEEIKILQRLPINAPKVGICRGGQLLNVLSGGSMWQHVNNHALSGNKAHPAITYEGDVVNVTSTHHQMMIPHKEALIMMTAKEASIKESDSLTLSSTHKDWPEEDVEACYYYHTNSFCFQPHPEYGTKDCNTKDVFYRFLHDMFAREIAIKHHKASLN